MTVLRTPNLLLRPCSSDDRDDFINLERDPDVMRFLNGGPVDHEAIDTRNMTFLMPRGEESFVWTARRETSGKFVGWFCLYPVDRRVAEVGYRLRSEDWGQGFATEGARALVAWAFSFAGYSKVVASTLAINYGSRRVMEKIGMRHFRTDPADLDFIPGAEHGEVWYEIERTIWACEQS